MSKQAKLADFLGEFARWFVSDYSHRHVIEAWERYQAAPDDPPQPPEMPECVAEFIRHVKTRQARQQFGPETMSRLKAVESHYRQPLKLEVGKCYEDTGGNVVSIVWQDPKFASHLVGVVRLTGEPRRYSKEGSCCDPNCEGIIREVKS